MKKYTLKAFLIFLLACAATVMYRYSFPTWIVALYGASTALWGVSALLFGLLYQKAKNNKKPLLKAGIFTAATLAVSCGLVFFVNNIILKEQFSTLTAEIITGIVSVFFTVVFLCVLKAGGKKLFPAVLSLLLIAAVGYSPLLSPMIDEYRIKHAVPQAAPAGLSHYTEKEREKLMDADYYVAPNGSDENDGSFEAPFATIEKARDTIRTIDRSGKTGITVAVKAGEYRVSSLIFTKEDAGTEECPIAYRAFGDGGVILNGGVTIVPQDFAPVTDEEMLARLSGNAKEKVLCVDLKEYGLTAEDWGKLYAIGSYNTASQYDGDWTGDLYCELFINDQRQVMARYPNEGYLYTEKVLDTGYGRESNGALTAVENWDEVRNPAPDVYGISKALAERIASWKTLDDVWMFGFWKYDWADASSPIGDFNAEKCTLSPKFVSKYGTKVNAPYYFYNIFEELDTPGEWYLDRESGMMYIYADKDISTAAVDLSITVQPILQASDIAWLTFDGFTIKGTRSDAILLSGSNNTVKNCLIKNVAGNAIYAEGYNNLIYANEITRTGKGGITLCGGEEETLTPGCNKADNNYIHDWSEIYQTYQPACSLNGVGNICSHNEIHNSPHEAITYSGNNHIIEYNDIHDVCLLTDDAGAIYAGRSWCCYGNVIRYNAVYNVGSGDHAPCGIYMDDALSGQTIYGNLLINIPSIGLHLGGGRDLAVYNNVLVNCNDRSISYDSRAREGVFGGWFTHSSQQNGDMWQRLFDSPWQTDVWKEAFPQMQKFSDDFDNTDVPEFVPNPAFSTVSRNLIVNINGDIGDISEAAERFSDIGNNFIYTLKDITNVFADAAHGDYTVINAPEGFKQLPLGEIGRY